MKVIYLFRHGEPERLEGVPDSEWPLSQQGRLHALELRRIPVTRVFSSPYRRASETAQLMGQPFTLDARLRERTPGSASAEMGDCWLRQYEDPDFKCPGGESLAEVGQRMADCLADILCALKEWESALVVSHAAAICAWLMRFCCVRVTDRAAKVRSVTWQGKQVYVGGLPPLSGFRLSFGPEGLTEIESIAL